MPIDRETVRAIAERLRLAQTGREPIAPVRDEIGVGNVGAAYEIQAFNADFAVKAGRHLIGRKIGLTSPAVQEQLGVREPDFGCLFADMEVPDGGVVAIDELIAPRVEAELVLVLARDILDPSPDLVSLTQAIEYVVPALEIVDSRIADWQIGIVDTVADNASCGRFVLGDDRRKPANVDFEGCSMSLSRNGSVASTGTGAACLGSPLNAALWLVAKMGELGVTLRAGDILLTGALGPMVQASSGDRFEAVIDGFAPVRIQFT